MNIYYIVYRNENPISCFLEFLVSLKLLTKHVFADPYIYIKYIIYMYIYFSQHKMNVFVLSRH